MTVALIDYGSGNIHSARKALERAALEAGLQETIIVTADPYHVRKADRIVLPGVGAFADCKRGLNAAPGLVEALEETVRVKGRPFLGICVGMQLLATSGFEHETTRGLDWIGGEVRKIVPEDPSLKVPHMGWNTLEHKQDHPLLDNIPIGEDGLHAYFVHSYAFRPSDSNTVVAVTYYGEPIPALIARDTIAGVQFHPEKSQTLGLALLGNFLTWTP